MKVPKLKAFWLREGRAAEAPEKKINDGELASRHTPLCQASCRLYHAVLDIMVIPSVKSEIDSVLLPPSDIAKLRDAIVKFAR